MEKTCASRHILPDLAQFSSSIQDQAKCTIGMAGRACNLTETAPLELRSEERAGIESRVVHGLDTKKRTLDEQFADWPLGLI